MMFEKANTFNASAGSAPGDERLATRPLRRPGEALRALEWSELTSRLNAARDLRLLLRTESQAPIEVVAASFGDAAASYFALLDDSEEVINPDALGQSKVLGATPRASNANRPDAATGEDADPRRSDARDRR